MISMKAFQHYLLGIKDVDDEHWEILSSLENFSTSISRDTDLKIVDHIVSLWESHSIKEENAMIAINYPYAKWHLKEHHEMMGRFKALRDRVEISSEYADRKWISSELQVIVCCHIDNFDKQISDYINKQSNGVLGISE
jgi:hemerythrin-like metal-binding protein